MRFVISPTHRRRRAQRGQALVEFSLVIMIFMTVIVSAMEFTFLFTSYVSIGFATHDASQIAATLGNTTNADTVILQRINNDITIPANPAQINEVDIYWVNTATKDASPMTGSTTVYTYVGGSHPFTMPDMTTIINLPYAPGANGYPPNVRCNVNLGTNCPASAGGAHNTVDTIAVKIIYKYKWITPFPTIISGSGTGPTLTSINVMRLEPVL